MCNHHNMSYGTLLAGALGRPLSNTVGRRGRDRMVVGLEFESHLVEGYSIQHYMIKCVSDLRQVGGFHRVIRFAPPIKLIATI